MLVLDDNERGIHGKNINWEDRQDSDLNNAIDEFLNYMKTAGRTSNVYRHAGLTNFLA
jgi:hypothetical protein